MNGYQRAIGFISTFGLAVIGALMALGIEDSELVSIGMPRPMWWLCVGIFLVAAVVVLLPNRAE